MTILFGQESVWPTSGDRRSPSLSLPEMDWRDLSKWSCENCPKAMGLKCLVLLTWALILQVCIFAGCSQAVKYHPCPTPARGCSQQPPEGSAGDSPSHPLTPLQPPACSEVTWSFRSQVQGLRGLCADSLERIGGKQVSGKPKVHYPELGCPCFTQPKS